jgi:hypothetical protein
MKNQPSQSLEFTLANLFNGMNENLKKPLSTAYFRFLQVARVIQSETLLNNLDVNTLAFLEAITLSWFEGKPLTISQAIGLSELGSPATLHKRLAKLRENDLVITQSIEGDTRSKLIIPSEKSMNYFDRLGYCFNN